MTLPLLLLLAIVAVVLAFRRHRRPALALTCLLAVTFLFIGSGLPASWMLRQLQAGQAASVTNWGAHNVIVLLGAGTVTTGQDAELALFSFGRLTKALQLYRNCKSHAADCRILSSGGDTHGYGKSEAELSAALLEQLGVPATDIIGEQQSMNTWQNAQFTAALLATDEADRVVLVSSAFHLPRAELYLSHFGVRAEPIRGDYATAMVSALPSAYNFVLTDLALHEYLGVLRYHAYNLLGWNVKATRPGAL